MHHQIISKINASSFESTKTELAASWAWATCARYGVRKTVLAFELLLGRLLHLGANFDLESALWMATCFLRAEKCN